MKQLWNKLTQREKAFGVAALCILILVLARYLLLTPFLERREWVKTQLDMQPQLLEKNLRYLNQQKEIAAALEAARAELKAIEPSLLSGDTPSVSASGLQQTVQGLAEKEDVQVITTRVLNPEVKGPFTKIPIQVEVSAKIDQLVNLIRGIESSEKLLVVDELNVRSLFRPSPPARQRFAPQPTNGQLRVGLIVSGFVRSASTATKRAAEPGETRPDDGKVPSKSPNKVSD